jgi:hypothetical protein
MDHYNLPWQPYRVCEWCREGYYPEDRSSRGRQKYCTEKCRAAAARSRAAPEQKARRAMLRPSHRDCVYCGESFPVSKYAWTRQRYCSNLCRGEAGRKRREQGIAVMLPVGVIGNALVGNRVAEEVPR